MATKGGKKTAAKKTATKKGTYGGKGEYDDWVQPWVDPKTPTKKTPAKKTPAKKK